MLSKEAALAAAATLLALAFALSTFERWLDRRRRHELAWTISLVMFAAGSAALWVGAANGFGPLSFRAFYLFGAVLNVPWLALGTVYLLAGRKAGDWTAAGVALVSAFAFGVVAVAPLRAAVVADDLPKGSDLFGPVPRVLAAVASGGAAVVLIGGALWSAVRLVRGRRAGAAARSAPPQRLVIGNVLIAVGTLVLSASGTLNARLGAETAFAVTLTVGIAVLFVGFLVATL
jgi:hypothetical protein